MKKTLHIANVNGMLYFFRFDLLKRLQKEGYEIHVCAADKDRKYVESFDKEGFTSHIVPMKRGINLFNAVKCIKQLVKIIKSNDFDIIHTNTPTGGMIGRLAAILAGHKKIYHTTAGLYFHENMKKSKYIFFSQIEKFLTARTEILFSPNQEDIETCKKLNIRPRKAIVYCGPSGVKLEKYNIEDKEACARQLRIDLGIEKDAFVIGIVGRLRWEKGYKEFIDVIQRLNTNFKIHAISLGSGSEEKQIKDYALEKSCINITFLGFKEDVPFYLKGIDVLLFPSYREGFPITTIEAMAAKTPVIAFDIRGCRESIISGKTGYIVPFKDVDSMYEKVVELRGDESLRKQMGENGRNRIIKKFLKEHHIENQLSYYI